MSDAKPNELPRAIGPIGAGLLVLNGAIGAGIFALPGRLQSEFGALSPFLFPAFATLVFVVALPMARLASLHERSGGPAAYVGDVFGAFAGFQIGWIYWLARAAAMAANSVVFAAYAAAFAPVFSDGPARLALILVLIGAVTALNVVGLRVAAFAQGLISVLKVAPLLALSLFAISLHAREFSVSAAPSFSAVEQASLLILYAFVGFEQALIPAGETKNAGRTLPRALLLTLFLVAGFYFLVQTAFAFTMNAKDFSADASATAPLVAFGQSLMGPTGGAIVLFAALFSLAGNLLSTATTAPRLAYSLAMDGSLPAWFARVHRGFQTPHHAILFFGAAAALLAASGGFALLAVISTLARLLVYLACAAALPSALRKRGARAGHGDLALCLSSGAICIWAIAQTSTDAFFTLALLTAFGTGLFAFTRARAQKNRHE